MRSKTLAILTIVALCLSLASALAPPLVSPVQAMETLHTTSSPPTTWLQGCNMRSVSLQPGDEIIQFTRDNLIVGTNPVGRYFTVGRYVSTISGDFSGNLTIDLNRMDVTWDELPPGTGKGYFVQTNTFDDGQGNTFRSIAVGDLDITSAPYPTATVYSVMMSGTGDFSGKIGIGTGSAHGDGTASGTGRRYSSSEVAGPYAMSGTGTSVFGNVRDLGSSTGPAPSDEFIQFGRDDIVIPKGDPASYMEGGSSSASITSGILTGTMTQTFNHISVPGTTPPYQGLTIAKFTGSNASGTISGVGIYDYLGVSGGSGSSYGYMFALRENGTGAYADKDFYGTVTITDTGGTWTSNGNLYILEPSTPTPTPAPAPISGTISGTGNGTYIQNVVTQQYISGSTEFNMALTGPMHSNIDMTIPVPFWVAPLNIGAFEGTLTIDNVDHTAKAYPPTESRDYVSSGQPPNGPWYWSFTMGSFGHPTLAWTTDGSNIVANIESTIYMQGTTYNIGGAYPNIEFSIDFSIDGTWDAELSNLAVPIQASQVNAGSGTIELPGSSGTVASIQYTTASPGTIVLAQYDSNPGGTSLKTPLGKYIEVNTNIPSPEITWPVELRVYYTDAEVAAAGLNENSLRMYRWDGSSWTLVAESGVDTAQNYIWANLYSFSGYGPMGDPLGGGGGAAGVPAFPNIYIGIAAALAAGIIAYFVRRRLVYQEK